MALIVECGPAGPYYHFEKTIRGMRHTESPDWLYILPVNRAVRLFKRRLLDNLPAKALADPPVFTFDNLLRTIYGYLPGARRIVPAASMPFLIEETLRLQSPDFHFFPTETAAQPGLVRKIGALIDELHRFGYDSVHFAENARDNIPEKKYNDLLSVMHQLEKLFGENYIDGASAVHQAAIRLTPELFRRLMPAVRTVFISGYGVFTPAMTAFIQRLSTVIEVRVKLEYVAENPSPFASIEAPLTQLKRIGGIIKHLPAPSVLARHLFNRQNPPSEPAAGHISLIEAPDRETEVEQIALKIKQLYYEQGQSPGKIAVTFPNPENYAPLLRRIFKKHGLPLNLSTGYPLRQAPLIETFVAIIETIIQGFGVEQVMNLYHSPFLKKGPAAMDGLHKYFIENRIRHLTKGWEKHLYVPAGKIEKLQQAIDALGAFLEPLYNFSNEERDSDTYHRDLIRLLRHSGGFSWYHNSGPHSERQKEREFRAYNAFIKMLESFFWSMKLLYGQTPIPLSDFMARLKAAIGQAQFNLTEWPLSAVQVMPRLEIQAVDYDILFLGGLVDGQLPRAAARDIFLDDGIRDELGLIASEELLDQDRFLFYTLLDAPARHVYLTRPHNDGGKALVASTFIDELRSCMAVPVESVVPLHPALDGLWNDFGRALQDADGDKAARLLESLYQFPDESPEKIRRALQRIKIIHNRGDIFYDADRFEGMLGASPLIRERLLKKFGAQLWSVSQLEKYAFCPMEFFFSRILKIEEWPEYESEISPIDRGNALHKALFRFFNYLKSQNQSSNPAPHKAVLLRFAREEFERLPLRGFFWELEKERFLGYDDTPGLLDKFVEDEQREIPKTKFIPTYFEFSFGGSGRDDVDSSSTDAPLILEQAGRRLQLSGKIDRIDVDADNHALVFDYKTGSVVSAGSYLKNNVKGYNFQLAVYLLAVNYFFKDKEAVYAGLFQLKDENNFGRKPMMTGAEYKNTLAKSSSAALLPNKKIVDENGGQLTLSDVLDVTRQQVFRRYDQLMQGRFTHSVLPDDKHCSAYCDFKRMCQKHGYKQKARGDE